MCKDYLKNNIIDYNENIENIEHYVTLKGEFRYKKIIQFLKKNKIDCTWKNVTNYIKYDKRILINSFKYIVFLEELFKSFIYKYSNDKKILSAGFRSTLEKYLALNDKANYDDIDLNLLRNSKEEIIQYRNSVVHNKILLDNNFSKKSLEEILNIFVKILPESYREGFKKDINNCKIKLISDTWSITI